MAEIMTWQTYKKNYEPKIYESYDSGGKGWARMVVSPTMKSAGFIADEQNDIDMDERKPRQIIDEDFQHIVEKAEILVYYVAVPTGHYAGHYKYLDIYWIPKNR